MNLPLSQMDYERALKCGTLLGLRCRKCRRVYAIPRAVCSECCSLDLRVVKLQPRGKVYSYTVVRFPPKSVNAEGPVLVCLIDLVNGAQILGRLVDIEPDRVRIGMEVEGFVPIDVNGLVIPGFLARGHKQGRDRK